MRLLGAFATLSVLAVGCSATSNVDSPVAESPTNVEVATAIPSENFDDPELPTPTPQAPGAASFEAERPATTEVPAAWNDPLTLDDAITEGQLPNGAKYLIRNNGLPGGKAQLWLVVHAGSINEREGSHGAAHFLEHMLFNGTERFPGNELVRVLEGFGASFGADVNAYTSYEETVYKLDVPARSAEALELGLEVLFQWATAATIDPDAVVAERGVVREEHRRSTETVAGRVNRERLDVLFEGTTFLGRQPIGSADVIDAMSAEQLREFYEQWYRPELMTIIAVGDFDVADMERRIADVFVQPASEEPAEPVAVDVGNGELPQPTFDVITDAEIQRSQVEVHWRYRRDVPLSPAQVRDSLVGDLATSMLNTRLFELVKGGESALFGGSVGGGGFTTTTGVVTMTARTSASDVQRGLEELLTEIERARQFGFTEAELMRASAEIQLGIDQRFASSATRQDARLAQDLVAYALGEGVLTTPEVEHSAATEALASITISDVQAFLFDVLASDPYVVAQGPSSEESVLPTPEQLAASYSAIVGSAVDEAERLVSDQTELMARPAPVEVVDQQRIAALDTTIVTYANGARLALRNTSVVENEVDFLGTSLGGYFAVEGDAVPLLGRAPGLVGGSGFESVDIVTLDRLLARSIASLSTAIGRSQETLSGTASTADIETLFQLVHLQMTQPTITELELRQFDERLRPLVENPSARPALAADLKLWDLRYGDSPWFRLLPTVEDLDDLDGDLLLAEYRLRFANAGDFVFVMVGDFDPDTVIELGASYLGTLPDNGVREEPIDRDPGLPEANLVATVSAGVGEQGRVRINWESPYPFTLEAEVAARTLEIMVNARLRDLVREQLGASYAPSAEVFLLSEPKPWVDTIIEIETDPERVEEVSAAVRDELDRIRAGDIDGSYLTLAVQQLAASYGFSSNNGWLELITFHTLNPDRPPGEFRDRTDIVQALTMDDMVATASLVFPPGRSVEIWLVPEG